MATSTRPAPTEEVQDHTTVPGAGTPADARRRTAPLSLAVILVPASVGLVRLLIGLSQPFAHAGDAAILETAIRRVASGTQALGPYSRFGFHQLGPAYFDLQAPFSWLTGGSPRSVFIGALVINFGAAAACVALVRWRLGERAARWSALVVAAYLMAVTPALLADPWNPYVLGTPLLLTVLLGAAAVAGSWPAAAGAAVTATFVVQTHLGAGITLFALFAVGAALAVAGPAHRDAGTGRQRPPGGGRRPQLLALGAAAVLAVFWVPPVVEEVTHSPGNVTLLARFFRNSHPELDATVDHSLGTAAADVGAHLATMPLGRPFDEPADPDGSDRETTRNVVAVAGLLAAGASAIAGWRRRHLFLASLGGLSLVACVAAVWSTTRIVGEVHPYLLVWTGALLLPAWMAAGILFGQRLTDTPPGRQALAAVVGVLGAILGWSMLRAPLPPVVTNPDVAAVAGMAQPWLGARGTGEVRVRIGQHDLWPLAVGLVNELDRDGVDVTVDQQWAALFGDQFEPTGRETTEVWFTAPTGPAPAPGAQLLGSVGAASVWGGVTAPSTR